MKRRGNGFSLLELVVALAILGLTIGGIFSLWNATHQRQVVLTQRDLLERAESSLIAFARFNSRLPCPAADSNGSESCGAGSKGYFPWKTVGLPDQAARRLRYGVFRNASSTAMEDEDLAVKQDRFEPLVTTVDETSESEDTNDGTSYGTITTSTVTSGATLLGNSNGIDLCHALRIAALDTASTTNTSTLYVSDGSNTRNVAFAIASPGSLDADGDGSPFDDLNVSSDSVFDSPQKTSGTGYDDAVRTRSFGTLFTDLGCGETLASADHAHFNVSTYAALMRLGMYGYYNQLVLITEAADIAVNAATANTVAAAAGVVSAAAEVSSAAAEALTKFNYGPVTLAGLATVAAAAGVTAAALELEHADDVYDEAAENQSEFNGTYHLQDYSKALDEAILTNAKNADAAGL